MVQAILNTAVPSAQKVSARAATPVERTPGQPGWDEEIVADIAGLSYVRGVVFTDGQGQILHRQGRLSPGRDTSESLDMLLSAMEQTGLAVAMGELQVGVGIFMSGTLISAAARGLRVTVLAESSANLGQLLSQVRRVFGSGHA